MTSVGAGFAGAGEIDCGMGLATNWSRCTMNTSLPSSGPPSNFVGVLPSPNTRLEAVERTRPRCHRWRTTARAHRRLRGDTDPRRRRFPVWLRAGTAFEAAGDAGERFVVEIDLEQFDHARDRGDRAHVRGGAQREDRALGRERDLPAVRRHARDRRSEPLSRSVRLRCPVRRPRARSAVAAPAPG